MRIACPNKSGVLYKELLKLNNNDEDLTTYAHNVITELQDSGLMSLKRYKKPNGEFVYTIPKTITEKSLAENVKGKDTIYEIDKAKYNQLKDIVNKQNISFINPVISKSGDAIFVNITSVKNNKIDRLDFFLGDEALYEQELAEDRELTVNRIQEEIKNKPGVQLSLFDTQYQLPQNRELEEYVASEKTIRDIAARMSDRIGIPVKFESDRTKNYKGKLQDGIAFVNLAYATLDTPIHEILGHPIIRALKNIDAKTLIDKSKRFSDEYFDYFRKLQEEGKTVKQAEELANKKFDIKPNTLYQNLLKELEYGKGKEVLDRVKRDYVSKGNVTITTEQNIGLGEIFTVYSNGKIIGEYTNELEANKIKLQEENKLKYTIEEQQEEAIVELLGLMTAEKLDKVKDGKLISLLKRLLKEMKAFMKQLLGQKEVEIDKLPDNMTLGDIADLLAYSNSKLILPGNEVIYTTPDNQQFKTYAEASNHISNLTKNIKDVNLDSIKLQKEKVSTIDEIFIDKFEIRHDDKMPSEYVKIDGKWYQEIFYTPEYFGDPGVEHYPISDEKIVSLFNSPEQIGVFKTGDNILDFLTKNKEYEQSKEIIEEWKKVNNIQYNPEEIYSRGQEFVSVVGAYSNFDVNLMMQNLLQHIEDNKKAGGEFTISAFTKPIDKQIGHLEGGGGKIKFKIYPQSKDILWAANTDVYSGSVWDASEKVNKDKKSELLGVSYTKYPSLRNVNSVQPNLANIVDDLAHHHNELGISLTGNNFRLEYDGDIPYTTKKIIDSVNSILDQKYGKLEKPEIKKIAPKKIQYMYVSYDFGEIYGDTIEEVVYKVINNTNEGFDEESIKKYISEVPIYDKPKNNFKEVESINSIKSRILPKDNYNLELERYNQAQKGIIPEFYSAYPNINGKNINVFALNVGTVRNEVGMWQEAEDYEYVKDYIVGETQNASGVKFWVLSDKFKQKALASFKEPIKPIIKEYTSQALINTKIAKLKEVAKKYPRSLIRSEVKPIFGAFVGNNFIPFDKDDLPFQKIPTQTTDNFNQEDTQIINNLINEGEIKTKCN